MRSQAISVCVAVVLAVHGLAGQQAPPGPADRMHRKLQAIVQHFIAVERTEKSLTTSFTQEELNDYFAVHGKEDLPPSVRQLTVGLLEAGKIDVRAAVDLDEVRKAETRGWLDPLAYVTGTVVVRTVGTLIASKGRGLFALESATVDGVAVPRALLAELVAFQTKSPELPDGVLIDQPFDLPMGIREVRLRRGGATVIQ